MKKIDAHGIGGILGTVASFTLTNYNALMAGIAATATAGYMVLRFCREWRKFRRDSVTIIVPKTQPPQTPT